MAGKRKTAFDYYLDDWLKDDEFAREYAGARAEIDAIDSSQRAIMRMINFLMSAQQL